MMNHNNIVFGNDWHAIEHSDHPGGTLDNPEWLCEVRRVRRPWGERQSEYPAIAVRAQCNIHLTDGVATDTAHGPSQITGLSGADHPRA